MLYFVRVKHPVKVHVWAGISVKGSTRICIFSGIMKVPLYVQILEENFASFSEECLSQWAPSHAGQRPKAYF